MGALTITLDPMNPGSGGNTRRAVGTLTFSTTYVTGTGDAFNPRQLGLEILDAMDIEVARNAGSTLQLQPLLTEQLPSNGTLHVRAYAIAVPPQTNIGNESSLQEIDAQPDLSAFSARFVAWGS